MSTTENVGPTLEIPKGLVAPQPRPSPTPPDESTLKGNIKVEGAFYAKSLALDGEFMREAMGLLPSDAGQDEMVVADTRLKKFKRGYLRLSEDFPTRFPSLTGVLKSRNGDVYLGEDEVGRETDMVIAISGTDYSLTKILESQGGDQDRQKYVASFMPTTVLHDGKDIKLTNACTVKVRGGMRYHFMVTAVVSGATRPVKLTVREVGSDLVVSDVYGEPLEATTSGRKSPEELKVCGMYPAGSDAEMYVELSSTAPATILGYYGIDHGTVSGMMVTADHGRSVPEATILPLLKTGAMGLKDVILHGYCGIDGVSHFYKKYSSRHLDLYTTTRLTDRLEVGRLDRPKVNDRIGWAELVSSSATGAELEEVVDLNMKTPQIYLLSSLEATSANNSVKVEAKFSASSPDLVLRLAVMKGTTMIYWNECKGTMALSEHVDIRQDTRTGKLPKGNVVLTVIVCAVKPEGVENLANDETIMRLRCKRLLITTSDDIVTGSTMQPATFEVPRDLVVRKEALRTPINV